MRPLQMTSTMTNDRMISATYVAEIKHSFVIVFAIRTINEPILSILFLPDLYLIEKK